MRFALACLVAVVLGASSAAGEPASEAVPALAYCGDVAGNLDIFT